MKGLFNSLLAIAAATLFTLQYSLPAQAEDSSVFEIPAAFALTGIAGSYGTVEVNGATLAVEEINQSGGIDGKTVKLVVEDTQSSNQHTVTAVKKLLTFNHARYLLGPTWLDSYQGALPILGQAKVFALTCSGAPIVYKSSPNDHPHVFSTWFNLEQEVISLLEHIKRSGKKRIAIVFDQDPFFVTVRGLVEKNATSLGLEVVEDHMPQLGFNDFRTILTKISKAKVDGIAFGFGDESGLLAFLKQRREMLPQVPLFGTEILDGYVGQQQFSPFMNDLDFVAPQVRNKEFAQRYQNRFGAPPVLSASTAYDAATIMLQALAKGHREPEALKEYLQKNSFETVTFGVVRFDALGGVASSDFVIKRVRDGKVSSVQP